MELYLLILCLCTLCSIRSDRQVRVVSVEEFPAYEAYNEGVSLTRSNQTDAAIAAYLRAVSLKADLPEAHQNLGMLYENKGDIESALLHHNKAVDLSAESSNTFRVGSLTNLAMALIKTGVNDHAVVEKAVAIFKEALQIEPKDENALFSLGSTYFNSRHYDLANETFFALLDINPSNGT